MKYLLILFAISSCTTVPKYGCNVRIVRDDGYETVYQPNVSKSECFKDNYGKFDHYENVNIWWQK